MTETDPLPWGRTYLMCPPLHFGVLYEINPWMHREVAVDAEAAQTQWQSLKATLEAAGASVVEQPPVEDHPDLVFTANAGIVNVASTEEATNGQFVPSRFRHPERQGEMAHNIALFEELGFRIDELPADLDHEGAGDALPFNDVLVSGYRYRSDQQAHTELSRLTGAPVRSVELVDPRLYHLDLTFCPLDDRRAICAPLGWDHYGASVMERLVPEPLVLDDAEALAFAANSVVVGTTVVMPSTPLRVGRQLERWGFTPVEVDVSAFLLAGGGCRCLTLALDVALGDRGRALRSGGDTVPSAGGLP